MATDDKRLIQNHAVTLAQIVQILKKDYDYFIPRHQRSYLVVLRQCESGGIDTAINNYDPPKGKYDKVDLQSWSRYQFKISSLLKYGKKYGFFDENSTMQTAYAERFNGELQEKIVIKMIDDPEVDLYSEFPQCHKKYHFLLDNTN